MFSWLDNLYCRITKWLYGIKSYPYKEEYEKLNKKLNLG